MRLTFIFNAAFKSDKREATQIKDSIKIFEHETSKRNVFYIGPTVLQYGLYKLILIRKPLLV